MNYIVGDGWRISLGLAGVPALILFVGSMVVPDTPCSLVNRDMHDEARAVLVKARGVEDVDEEFADMQEDTATAKLIVNPWANIVKPRYRPQLVLAAAIPLFQQFTGINAIMFYTPVLFASLGTGHKGALLNGAAILSLTGSMKSRTCHI